MALERSTKKPAANHDRRNVWLLVVTTILVVASIFMFTPPSERINQGLDIQGGLSVVLTAKNADGGNITDEDMEASRAIIETRVNALGASEATVQLQGDNQILVQIPGLSDSQEALNTIGKTGQLVFARLDSFTDEEVKEKIEQGDYGTVGTITDEFGYSFPSGKMEHLTVEPGTYTPLITGSDISRVDIGRESETSSYYSVNLTLNSKGAQAFADATKELAADHGQIVIILDDEVQSAPAVQGEIPGGQVSITGNYTLEDAQSLETVLESGSLPINFEYAQAQVVGPTLGQEALAAGVLVALIGLAIVMLYLLFFYKGLGIIVAAAMAIFAVLYLGILALLSWFGQFSLSLAGIAGIVLTIGMAADSSVLTLERFREEIRMGRSVRAASKSGVRHAILTSIDADLVTLVSALCLFFLASASVKGFGLTLALGIFCDIIMMVLFKAPLIRLLAPKVIAKNPGLWGISDSIAAANLYKEAAEAEGVSVAEAETGLLMNTSESDAVLEAEEGAKAKGLEDKLSKIKGRFIKHDINFLGYRKILLTIAAVAMVLCLVVVGVRGLNFGIEFIGGSSTAFHGTGDITTEQMRDAFNDAGEPDAVIQTTSTNGEAGFLVRTTTTSPDEATEVANAVAATLGLTSSDFEVTTIGPDWGPSVITSSLIAFLVSIVLIIIYIAIRFEYKMGVMAVVALFHDLILVVGIYALVGREVNPNTIAALLTILGYSLYDTVVVFHRINDNMKDENIRCTFMTMANHSMNQVFIRTINTTLTSFIPVFAMLLFGGETLKDFAFAMAIGLIAGSYSSIAIATPLYSMWKTREPRYARLQKRYGDEVGLFEFDRAGAPALASVPVERIEKEAAAEAKAQAEASGATEAETAALREKSEEAARRKVQESVQKKAKTSYRASETYVTDAEMLEAAEEAARKAGRASDRARRRSQRNNRK
ncbi:MAG: protein translocase subunit SecD [Eggerthellaceae bacterium]|nr:protein translocase subunit SecD [Eggerthellaceae bacterium]